MNRDDFARAKELFLSVCKLPESERFRFLDQECGDNSELRREIDTLLQYHMEDQQADDSARKGSDSGSGSGDHKAGRRFKTGEVLDERYRIVTHLGRGGVGEVYRAHDLVLDEEVALKFLSRPRNAGLGVLLNEVRLARKVSHPNVCRVFDMGTLEGEQFFSMEYVEGENLASLLRRIGRLPQDKLGELAQQLCAGLAAAHARGVIHRDLKPANVMIDQDGSVRITDFGIATSSRGAFEVERFGTLAYMAPEQLAGEPATVQSDLYSLGLVLYEAATGRMTFEATTPAEYVDLHQTKTPEAPSNLVETLDSELEAVILKCLDKNPRRRPKSALAVAAAIPGSDPLRLARDAGVTPSPEVVAAAADSDEGRSNAGIVAASLVLLCTLIGFLTLSDRIYWAADSSQVKAPEVLAEQASQVLRELGYPEPVDRAWGFAPCCTRLTGEAAHRFWYREAQTWLVPDSATRLSSGRLRVDTIDPSPLKQGMVQVVVDSGGRLLRLEAFPQSRPADTFLGREESPQRWNAVLTAAGFDVNDLRGADPVLSPRVLADVRGAWVGPDPRGSQGEIHIDAGLCGGIVTFFDASPDKDPQAGDYFELPDSADGLVSFFDLAGVFVFLAALAIAWVNFKRRRGDFAGARKLVMIVVGLRLGHWLLTAAHVPVLGLEVDSFEVALGGTLVEALVVWVVYLALEPLARRWWPQVLVGWNRIQRRGAGDPVLGWSLLIGATVGTVWALAARLDLTLARALELEMGPFVDGTFPLDMALSPRLAVGELLVLGLRTFYWGLGVLFVLAVLSAVVRVRWIAVVLFAVGLGLLEAMQGSHLTISWLVLGVPVGISGVWVLVRYGLLAFVTAVFCQVTLIVSPITLDLQSWFAGTGLFGLLTVAAVGGLGAWLAMRRPRPGSVEVRSSSS